MLVKIKARILFFQARIFIFQARPCLQARFLGSESQYIFQIAANFLTFIFHKAV